ncbi:MAG: hypothetical protein ACR2FN_02035 [Chitinophagaceae bacterium]
MKKAISILIFFFSLYNVNAQVMQAKPQWSTISVPQLKCWECKTRLEDFLSREKGPNGDAGIIRWIISMPSATLRIQYFPDRITLDYLRTEIANAGFDADTVKAETDAYKALPPICKRKEDGGGPQKGKPCNIPPDERVGLNALPKN